MSSVIGSVVRDDDDGIAIRLEAGTRRGCYRVGAEEVPDLLAGVGAATLRSDGAPVGDLAVSRGLRVLLGAFRAGLGFLEAGTVRPVVTAAFMVPRAHLAAHYNRHDGPVDVLGGGA